ncbi:MAG: TolC family protein [Acidobacteria bacterium]|nr:TolC family protein [Acidobacteriota bacterium]MBV9626350.1 TolC family protein [Acidobacteriota bacterium]
MRRYLRRWRSRTLLTASVVFVATAAYGQARAPVSFRMPKSYNPISAYSASEAPEPQLTNSPRLRQLIRDGKLSLSLADAIRLALENNLDIAIARYNLPIADMDILRTRAGGVFRGVNAGVVQGTPGGGVGGFGTGAPGAGAGGTTAGAGGAGAGASGLVQSTLGVGTPVASYDPAIVASIGAEHQTTPLANQRIYGVPLLQLNTGQANFGFSQAFATGSSIAFEFNNNRQTTNSPFFNLSPALGGMYRLSFQQQLLSGFGFGPNLRYLRIAKNNKKISDIAFKDQVIATVTQIENIYWDLVNAYEQSQVNEQSLAFAQQSLENARKQLQLESIPALEVTRAEAEVSKRDQDLTIARTSLQLQELLMKNALTKSLDDPVLESVTVVPTDTLQSAQVMPLSQAVEDLIRQAMQGRPELAESDVDLINRQISRKAARNALLPSLALAAFYGGSGLAGSLNPVYNVPGVPNSSNVPVDYRGALANAFNNTAPDYYIGLNLNIPIRNRVAKADQYRSELEYRQAELRREELRKQIRIEVRNAEYALQQTAARVEAARKARDLARRTFEITRKEQTLGAGSTYQTLAAQRDLALAELDLVTAMTVYEKAKVEVDRATGVTLEHNGIEIQDAISGTISDRRSAAP